MILNVILSICFAVCIGFAIWNLLKLHQLNGFSDTVRDAIDEQFDNRMALIQSGRDYADIRKEPAFLTDIDIEACYANYRRAVPWNRNFKSMIVYITNNG